MNFKRNRFEQPLFISGIYAAIWLLIAYLAFTFPLYNWDIIPYVACVLDWQGLDNNTLHQHTFAEMRAALPSGMYDSYTQADNYRQILASNPVAFAEQLPFHHIRPLYTALNSLWFMLGVPLAKTTILTSILSVLWMAALVFLWLQRSGFTGIRLLFSSLLIALCSGILQISNVSTADALSAALLLTAFYCIQNQAIHWAYGYLLLSLTARSDNIIVIVIIWLVLSGQQIKTLKQITQTTPKNLIYLQAIQLAMLFFIYGLIQFFSAGYGWQITFYHTFIEQLAFPNQQTIHLTFNQYLTVLLPKTIEAFYSVNSLFFNFALLIFLNFSVENKPENTIINRNLILNNYLMLALLIHLFLFPAFWQRFFIAQTAFLLITLLQVLRQKSISLTV